MIQRRAYIPETDFVAIRDFLSRSYQAFGRPLNWRIERWNYARYFIAPMLGHYGSMSPADEEALQAIRFWEESVAVWESESDGIVGIVNLEHPDPAHPGFGEAFLQRHPAHPDLLEAMICHAEEQLSNPATGSLHLYVYEYDRQLQIVLEKRGFEPIADRLAHESEYLVGNPPQSRLPSGYMIRSMADTNDVERRRKAFGLAFHHPEPPEWPSAFSYRELQRAPDYRPELDLYIVAPDGAFVAFCLAWYDAVNRMATLEPVGTVPEYRRLGLATEVVQEDMRRVARLGAERVQVGSGQRFYEALGFEKKYSAQRWQKVVTSPDL